MAHTHNKIRIVHVITCLSAEGAGIMLYRLLAHLDHTRFEPIVIGLGQEAELANRLRSHGITVHTLATQCHTGIGWHVVKLARLLRQLQPDIVQGWMYHGNVAASLANALLGKRFPVLWGIQQSLYDLHHESRLNRWIIQMGARLSQHCEYILYNSYLSSDQHLACGYAPQKTRIIPNGFDTQLFAPDPYNRNKIRQSLGIPADAIVIGMIAHYHPSKNHALFLEAANLLMQHQQNIHFLLAGSGVTADTPALAALLQHCPHRHKLHLLGERKDIPDLLNAMDMFSLTSSGGEGFPNALGEAMACGIPCIATDVGDTPLITGNTGRILQVAEATPSALAFAWLEWINAGDIWRQELGQRALQRIRKHYNIHHITLQYQNLYKELLNHVRTGRLLLPLQQA